VAKVQNNLVIHGLSGMLGQQLVIRHHKNGRTSVAAAPTRSEGREPTEQQKQHQEHFRQAVLYAKAAKNKPEYEALAKSRGVSAFNVATADFFHPPEIRAIDVSAYTGGASQTIQINAVDDVKVATVGVLIATDDNTLVERGQATLSPQDPHRWTYTTTAAAPSASVKIVVDVADLAGQVTEESMHT
jgi:tartrate dehydratase beta subunit/fumarate hydratase class I family protein